MLFEKDDPARIFELSAGIHLRSRRAAERALRPHGLTYAQYGGLLALVRGGSMSQSDLAAALETDTTTAMVVRGSLERKGLVDRKSHPEDGRVKMLNLTSKGQKLAFVAMKEIDAFYAKLAGLVSDSDLRKTLPILEKLHELSTDAAGSQAARIKALELKTGVKTSTKAVKAEAKRPAAVKKQAAKPSTRPAAKAASVARKPAAKKLAPTRPVLAKSLAKVAKPKAAAKSVAPKAGKKR